MNEEIKKLNEAIEQDNEIIDTTLTHLIDYLKKIDVNIQQLKVLLVQKTQNIQNANANNFILKIEKQLIDSQINLQKIISKIDDERKNSKTKIYSELYALEEEKNEEKK